MNKGTGNIALLLRRSWLLVLLLICGIADAQVDTLVFKDGREITGTFVQRKGGGVWFRHRENSLESERFYNEADVERIEFGAAVEAIPSEADGDIKQVGVAPEPTVSKRATSATAVTVRNLAAFHNRDSRDALIEIQMGSKSRAIRKAASEALLSIFEKATTEDIRDQIGPCIARIAMDAEIPEVLRTRAMQSLVAIEIDNSSGGTGIEVLDLAVSESSESDRGAELARTVICDVVAQRPVDIQRFMLFEHRAVREAAIAQAEAWQSLDPRLPLEDILLLVQQQQRYISGFQQHAESARQYLEENPRHRKTTNQKTWESQSALLEKHSLQIERLKQKPILWFASEWVVGYHNAMHRIAAGERRAEERVGRAYEPRSRYEFFFEETEWQHGPAGSFDQHVVGESSIVIDLDAILGPKPDPTDADLDKLRMPDRAHAAALESAKGCARQLFRLSPTTVDLAVQYFQTVHGVSDKNLIPLPPRP